MHPLQVFKFNWKIYVFYLLNIFKCKHFPSVWCALKKKKKNPISQPTSHHQQLPQDQHNLMRPHTKLVSIELVTTISTLNLPRFIVLTTRSMQPRGTYDLSHHWCPSRLQWLPWVYDSRLQWPQQPKAPMTTFVSERGKGWGRGVGGYIMSVAGARELCELNSL